jgi:AbrB family looped-hinge helix DNA binding protein
MPKVTSKLQVTVPRAVAERFGIKPGDQIAWEAAGTVIHMIPPGALRRRSSPKDRVKAFDEATARQRRRQQGRARTAAAPRRGWRRDQLYVRAQPR